MGSRLFCLCLTTRGTSFWGWEKPEPRKSSDQTRQLKSDSNQLVNQDVALVTSTVAFRIYKSVLAALGKTQDKSHPFQRYLDADVELPAERVLALTEEVVFHLNTLITKFKSIYLVENMIESPKFAAAMYLMTFVGRLVNMVTLLIMAWVAIFAWPRIYQDNQTKIDEALAPIKVKVEELTSKLTTAKKME